jgi:hypothetical protein
MHKWVLLAVLLASAALFSSSLKAEDTLQFPRIRQLQDLVRRASDSRYKDQKGLLGQDAFTAGFSAGYTSDYYWRGFKLFKSDMLWRGDAYVNVYGFEGSVWAIWDAARKKTRPLEVDYRFRYKFEIEGALISVGYTFYDFSGSDGDLGARSQGFGRKELEQFPGHRFPPSIHELHFMLTYFTSVLQSGGANLRYTLNYWQRIDDEGSRWESTISLFVDSPGFTVFGDYFEITTTTIYQHRYLTNRTGFQGQINSARVVYNLDKYGIFPMFFQLEVHYYVAFDDDFVDGFYFGGSVNFRF